MTFELGRLVATPAAIAFCEKHKVDLLSLVRRHQSRDWGDLERDDKEANERALTTGARIFSSYRVADDRIWIITDAADDDQVRASTCVLLPSDY